MHVASTCLQMQEVHLCYDWMDAPQTSSNQITYHLGTSRITMFRSVAWRCLVMQPRDDINVSLSLLACSKNEQKAVADGQTPMIL